MAIYLYLDRGTVIHRLHPTVKVISLFVMFWSVYWVDNPLSMVPIGIFMAWFALYTGSWKNFPADDTGGRSHGFERARRARSVFCK